MHKLLFLSHRIPYPPDKGDKIRAWHILRHLMRSHEAYVGCFVDDAADWAHVPALRAQCAELACLPLHPRRQKLRALARLRHGRPFTLDYFGSASLQRWVRETVSRERIGRIFVFCSAMAPYALDVQAERRILDFIHVDSAKWTDYALRASYPMRAIWAREGRTLLAYECAIATQFDHTLFVSDQELNHFRTLAPDAAGRMSAMSNGVDFEFFSPAGDFARPFPAASRTIVFTGAMDYRPNIDAVAWFAREVLPSVHRSGANGAEFWIVGSNPDREVRRLADQRGVHVTGRVPDTRPYLAHADVVVAPLRIARGIQNKVLEAMAMARPVVATPQAIEGLRVDPGQELLLAGTAPEMATHVTDLLAGAHQALGIRARCAVEARYDWSANLAQLDTLWQP
jgi:polysaccharide biosynthesis protein PslH